MESANSGERDSIVGLCPRQIKRLLEDLDLRGFATQEPLQLAHSYFEPAHLGGRRACVVVAHHPPLPSPPR
jgi:hypothetical protein